MQKSGENLYLAFINQFHRWVKFAELIFARSEERFSVLEESLKIGEVERKRNQKKRNTKEKKEGNIWDGFGA